MKCSPSLESPWRFRELIKTFSALSFRLVTEDTCYKTFALEMQAGLLANREIPVSKPVIKRPVIEYAKMDAESAGKNVAIFLKIRSKKQAG